MCCEGLVENLPQLEKCCFCARVETGSKILAWFGTVTAFIYTIFSIIGVVALVAAVSSSKTPAKPEDREAQITLAIFVGVIFIIFLSIVWVMALLLLIGLYKEDMGKVRIWLKVNMCLYVFALVGSIFNVGTLIFTGKEAVFVLVQIFSLMIQYLVAFYFLLVIKSHYVNKTQNIQSVRA
ncbi:hypothetical protein GE061_008334 [Apolygus lucorum]|uniref:Uncharacterized protein n=1 Tax=Apolygus lucorum TaxID=248454 RepID=A0A8S9WS01_APOLU|nr:hypothetical protein GE061_008334 [Apolygus lucorum]